MRSVSRSVRSAGEFGATTGRPRRCGWLDLNVVKHACIINGLTDIVLTKIDVLSGMKQLKICVAYEIDGERYDHVPSSMEDVARATPIYEELEGWNEDLSQMTSFEELPLKREEIYPFHRGLYRGAGIDDLSGTGSQEQHLCTRSDQ